MSWAGGASMRSVVLHALGVLLILAGVGLVALTAHGVMTYRVAAQRHGGEMMDLGNDASLQPGQYGHMARVVGTPTVLEPPSDSEFGLKADTPVLTRHVEMFQWRELHFGSQISYELAWVDHPVDASRFAQAAGHANPASFPLTQKTFDGGLVQIGGFRLSPLLIRALPGSAVVQPDLKSLPPNLAASFGPSENYLTTSSQPQSPRLGDIRVSWEKIPLQPITVFARIDGDKLVPAADAADGRGYDIEIGDVPLLNLLPDMPLPPTYVLARRIASVLLAALGAFVMLVARNRRGDPLLALGLGTLMVGAVSTMLWLGNDTSSMAIWLLVTLLGGALAVWRLRWHKRRSTDRR
jgi:hypothetical protein